MKVTVTPEGENPDVNAMKCVLPTYSEIDEHSREMVMESKSTKTKYWLGDKAGQQIGRVQYFLNSAFKELLQDGAVNDIYG